LVVTGDHGEEFREHGHIAHGSSVTNEQIHVPGASARSSGLADPGPPVHLGRITVVATGLSFLPAPLLSRRSAARHRPAWPQAAGQSGHSRE
jgi:hypothetical protein